MRRNRTIPRLPRPLSVMLLALAGGCATTISTVPPAPERSAQAVSASFDRTWDATIDVFANRNTPVATLDRSSGLIMAQPLTVSPLDARKWANCPVVETSFSRFDYIARRADFSVLVRPTEAGTTVRVSARWVGAAYGTEVAMDCQSTGVWESEFERMIKSAAETPPR